MSTTNYVLDGELLKVVDDGHFVNDGVPVHRIVLPNGDAHLVERRDIQVTVEKDGVLEVRHGGQWLRSYGSWLYVDQIPFVPEKPFTA